MKCPYCGGIETKVMDSRETDDCKSIRRRRACVNCDKRFTTYEKIDNFTVRVIKRTGIRENFDKKKILSGFLSACHKRAVSIERIDKAAYNIENKILSLGKKEIDSSYIGNLVMEELKKIDEVAFIRFASVYKRFKCIDEFREELEKFN
ncbi:MAG: transcriptional regulator NrdR [Candidatus Muiribacteriota bacterium]